MAQTPRTGVIIRERVEVVPRAATAGQAARTPPDPCAAPSVAEFVVYNPTSYTVGTTAYGAPMAGTVTATSPCGTASGSLAGAFTLSSTSNQIYYYEPAGSILRMPISATAPLPAVSATIVGAMLSASNQMYFGCTSTNCMDPPGTLVGAAMGLRGGVVGWATGRTYAWPDTVVCGSTTPLPITLVKPDSTEGYVGPDSQQTYQLPGWNPSSTGSLAYDNTSGGTVVVPYGDTRVGEIAYTAPACAAGSTGATLWVTGFPSGGLLSHFFTVVPEPPVAFLVTATPDTLATNEGATVRTVAVAASGNETLFSGQTQVTLSVSDPALGVLSFQNPANGSVQSGASITVPYTGARGWPGYGTVTFTATGNAPERDTTVTITASGGGLSGSDTVVRLSRLRLELAASPSALPNGGASRLRATIRGAGASSIPAASPLTFTLADPSLGTLYRQSTQETGQTLTGVPQSAAAQGDVVFNRDCSGPASPGGTAHITAAVAGWAGLVDEVAIGVGERFESSPSSVTHDTLYVSASPSPLAPGDSAVVTAVFLGAGDCAAGGVIPPPDSTAMAITISSEAHGRLEGERGQAGASLSVPYGDLKAGRVKFVSLLSNPPRYDTPIRITASGDGLSGVGRVVVRGFDGEGPDSLMVSLGPDEAIACGDSTALIIQGALRDTTLTLPGDIPIRLAVAVGSTRLALVWWPQSGGAAVEGDSLNVTFGEVSAGRVYVKTFECEPGMPVVGVVTAEVDAPWIEGVVSGASALAITPANCFAGGNTTVGGVAGRAVTQTAPQCGIAETSEVGLVSQAAFIAYVTTPRADDGLGCTLTGSTDQIRQQASEIFEAGARRAMRMLTGSYRQPNGVIRPVDGIARGITLLNPPRPFPTATVAILEAKMVNAYAINDDQNKLTQARAHIDEVASTLRIPGYRDTAMGNVAVVYISTASQPTISRYETDPVRSVINYAERRGVALYHLRLYRNGNAFNVHGLLQTQSSTFGQAPLIRGQWFWPSITSNPPTRWDSTPISFSCADRNAGGNGD